MDFVFSDSFGLGIYGFNNREFNQFIDDERDHMISIKVGFEEFEEVTREEFDYEGY